MYLKRLNPQKKWLRAPPPEPRKALAVRDSEAGWDGSNRNDWWCHRQHRAAARLNPWPGFWDVGGGAHALVGNTRQSVLEAKRWREAEAERTKCSSGGRGGRGCQIKKDGCETETWRCLSPCAFFSSLSSLYHCRKCLPLSVSVPSGLSGLSFLSV